MGVAFAALGCNRVGAPASPTPQSGTVVSTTQPTQPRSSRTAPRHAEPQQSGVVIEPDRRARVSNPIYHPGMTQSLNLSGKFEGVAAVTFTGKLTQIVTRESSKGKPINVMNSGIEIDLPDGKTSSGDKVEEVYQLSRSGKLKLLYMDLGSGPRWVDTSTCAGEPSEYIEGSADGCEVHFDDGSITNNTRAITKDDEYLKVTEIGKKTDSKGEHDSTESYWYDISTGSLIRYSGSFTDSDGSQMTLTGR